MSQINFKLYSEIVDEATSEERLNEIFGLFKNNEKVEKLRKEREALLAKKKQAAADKDKAWANAKNRVDAENRADMYWKNKSARSQQADARGAELSWGTNESMLEEGVKIRHDHGALVTSLDHFGTQGENPDGHRELVQALKFLDKKVPQDKVWAYDADGFADIFERISRKLKVQNPDHPDLNDVLRAGFTRLRKIRDTVFLKKGNVLVMISDDTPPMYVLGGKELETE